MPYRLNAVHAAEQVNAMQSARANKRPMHSQARRIDRSMAAASFADEARDIVLPAEFCPAEHRCIVLVIANAGTTHGKPFFRYARRPRISGRKSGYGREAIRRAEPFTRTVGRRCGRAEDR
jgi:hypothetical protein